MVQVTVTRALVVVEIFVLFVIHLLFVQLADHKLFDWDNFTFKQRLQKHDVLDLMFVRGGLLDGNIAG